MLWTRALVVYPLTILLFRFIGRSLQFSSRPYDVAVQVLLGSAAAQLIFDANLPIWRAFTSLGSLVLMHAGLAFLSLWNPAKSILVGRPHVLIENGQIIKANLLRNQISIEELTASLREKGFHSLADVEFALLEASGKLSVVPTSQSRPVTPRDLQLATEYEGFPSLLISDGQLMRHNLRKANLSDGWLQEELLRQGVLDYGEVLFASLDTQGKLFVVRNQDVPLIQSVLHGAQVQTSPGLPPRIHERH